MVYLTKADSYLYRKKTRPLTFPLRMNGGYEGRSLSLICFPCLEPLKIAHQSASPKQVPLCHDTSPPAGLAALIGLGFRVTWHLFDQA